MRFKMSQTATITPVQVLAVIIAIVSQLVNDAVVNGQLAQLITGIAGIVVPFGWLLADAIIHRHTPTPVPAPAPTPPIPVPVPTPTPTPPAPVTPTTT